MTRSHSSGPGSVPFCAVDPCVRKLEGFSRPTATNHYFLRSPLQERRGTKRHRTHTWPSPLPRPVIHPIDFTDARKHGTKRHRTRTAPQRRTAMSMASLLMDLGVDGVRDQGREVTACCPYHDDRDPSFSINRCTGLWRCFSCDARGNLGQLVRDLGELGVWEAANLIRGHDIELRSPKDGGSSTSTRWPAPWRRRRP